MEEQRLELLGLFDFFWFRHHVLLDRPFPAVPSPATDADVPSAAAATGAEKPSITGPPVLHMPPHVSRLRRSLSDELAFASSSDSALLVRRPLKLQTIFSGKATFEEGAEAEGTKAAAQSRGTEEKPEARVDEVSRGHREEGAEAEGTKAAARSRGREEKPEARVVDEVNMGHSERKRNHRERRRATRSRSQDAVSKSLSELEFEELKGLMDLGFTFPERAESDRRLLSIVPGLRRRASSEEGVAREAEEGDIGGVDDPAVARPYLSESWVVVEEIQAKRRSHAHDHLLRNWRLPAAGEGVDMKDHLRSWAHTVASAVR